MSTIHHKRPYSTECPPVHVENCHELYQFFAQPNKIRQHNVIGGLASLIFQPQIAFAQNTKNHIQDTGHPFILAANHPTQLDPPVILGAAVYSDPTLKERFAGKMSTWTKAPLLGIPGLGNFFIDIGCLPVFRDRDVDPSMTHLAKRSHIGLLDAAVAQLINGRNQLIFPEGTNSVSRYYPNEPKDGISALIRKAIRAEVEFEVLPVGIAYHNKGPMTPKKPYIYFGEPIVPHNSHDIKYDIQAGMQRSLVEAHRLAA